MRSLPARPAQPALWGRPALLALASVAALSVAALSCGNGRITVFGQLAEARRLSAEMQVQFSRETDAGNRAVMADTDETAAAFVREAEEATTAAATSAGALAPLLQALNFGEETRLLEQFGTKFEEYRTLDRTILDLAVENTNLKAQRLSFGDAQNAADAFGSALQHLSTERRAGEDWHVQALISSAMASIREIQVLQAPHIAESDEAAMTRLETQAAEAEASARRSLNTVATLVRPAARPRVAEAREALGRFMSINAQIVVLSRRNSDVRSLALALGQKRKLAAACEESLRALQDGLARRSLGGTR